MPDPKPLLPHYERPPLIEVVCGVQLDPLPGFNSLHLGRLHEAVRGEYPDVEEQPPLPEIFEGPGGTETRAQIAFELPPLRRLFFKTTDGNFLLQVQPTRFLANWRRVREADSYPRFSAAFDRFKRGWKDYVGVLAASGLPVPRVNQYELSYINHLGRQGDTFPDAMARYLRAGLWHGGQREFFPKPKSAMMRMGFPLGTTSGSLHVTVNHGTLQQDRRQVMVVDMTARGPAASDCSDLDSWFQLAHEWIVRGFTELTSEEAHREWGRLQ